MNYLRCLCKWMAVQGPDDRKATKMDKSYRRMIYNGLKGDGKESLVLLILYLLRIVNGDILQTKKFGFCYRFLLRKTIKSYFELFVSFSHALMYFCTHHVNVDTFKCPTFLSLTFFNFWRGLKVIQ